MIYQIGYLQPRPKICT